MPLIGNVRGKPDDWRGIAWGFMAMATVILVLDASTILRVHDFESRRRLSRRSRRGSGT